MEFTYTIIVGQRYSALADEYDYDEREITIEPREEDIIYELADILIEKTNIKGLTKTEYKTTMAIIKKVIKDNYMLETLAEEYEDDLKERFYEMAYEEAMERQRDLWR